MTMLCLLGQPGIREGTTFQPLTLRPKEWALLARVSLGGEAVTRARLAELLSPDADDPRRALRWHLKALKASLPKAIGDHLGIDPESVCVRVPTDAAAFAEGASRVRDHPGGPEDLDVLSLYRSDLCAGLAVAASPAFDTWLYVQQESLRRLYRQAASAFGHWAAAEGRHESAIGPLCKLVEVDPYFEDGHVLLIECWRALGEGEAARSAYRVYERIVRQELGAEPRASVSRWFERRESAGRPLPRERLLPLRDVTIHTVEWPGGEPTVLGIHGSAGSAYSLTALGERLAPHNRFIALDLRGHGFSDKPPSGYDLWSHVADVGQLIDELELDQPVLLGFSLGGPVASAVAGRRAVGGLILLEAAIGDRAFLEQHGRLSVLPLSETFELRFSTVDEYLQRWRAENARYSDEAERWIDRFARYELAPLSDGKLRRRGLREALLAEYGSVLEADTLGFLSEVVSPVLIVRGAQPWLAREPWLSDAAFEAQRHACRAAEVFVAPSSNHVSLIRDPEPDLIEAMRTFIRSTVTTQPLL